MTLVELVPNWLFALFALALLTAAFQDLLERKISNLVPLALLIGAFVAIIITGFSSALWQNGLMFVAILVLGTFSFGRGWVGGGDVKLLATAALWFALDSGLRMIVVTFITGGIISAIMLVVRKAFRGKPEKKGLIPYAVAIAIGAVGAGVWLRI